MTMLQVNLPDDVDKKVEHYQIERNLKTKAEAAIEMLRQFQLHIKMEGPKVKKDGSLVKQ